MNKLQPLIVQRAYNNKHTPRMSINLCYKPNHRKILKEEVVFDIDCKVKTESNKIMNEIILKLFKDDINFSVWDTGGKGYHIHCFFKELKKYNYFERKTIRYNILKKYSGEYINYIDFQKTSDNVMIRLEYSEHEKNKKQKTKIFCTNEFINEKLPSSTYSRNKITEQNHKSELFKLNYDYKYLNNDQLLQYALRQKIPSGNRNNILLQHIAKILILSGVNEEESNKIINQIARQQLDNNRNFSRTINEIKGWLRFLKKKPHALKINKTNLNWYIYKNKLNIIPYGDWR